MFAEKLLAQFKLNPAVKPTVVKWSAKMTELMVAGRSNTQWSSEVYQLFRYCEKHKLAQFSSFDPMGQFSTFMETWRISILTQHQIITSKGTQGRQLQRQEQCLTDLLMENLNLDKWCDEELRDFERELMIEVEAGADLQDLIGKVRNFCRSHAADTGFYDERGRLNHLVTVWYDSIHIAHSIPISAIDLRIDDEITFNELMHEIECYVAQEV